MIGKPEIIRIAGQVNLNPHVVEKDYALGRLFAGIFANDKIADKNEHRSYRIDRIQGARSTNQIFTPRYAVELTPSGPVPIPPTDRRLSSSSRGGHGTLGILSAPSPLKRSIRLHDKRRCCILMQLAWVIVQRWVHHS